MDSAELKRRIQLALSYREKVKKAIEAHARGQESPSAKEALPSSAICAQHFEAAKAELKRVREALRLESPRLAGELREALNDQHRLEASIREGRTSRQAARETSRQIDANVDALRQAIAELNAANAAQTAEDIGGFLDLPFDAYRRAIEGKEPPSAEPKTARARMKWRFKWTYSNALSVVVVVVGLVACVQILGRSCWGSGEVSFEARLAPNAPQTIEIVVKNGSMTPITFHAPWAAGTPSDDDTPTKPYGVTLRIRESAEGPWKLVTASVIRWIHKGLPLDGDQTFTIEPGFSLALSMDVADLTESGMSPKAVQLEFATGEGTVITTFETQVAL